MLSVHIIVRGELTASPACITLATHHVSIIKFLAFIVEDSGLTQI